MDPKWIKRTAQIGDLQIRFESEVWPGSKPLDTKVFVNDGLLCWICYDEIDDFLTKMNQVITDHRI